MATIYDLPEEVLEFLFSKLSFSDRKTVRLVSKHWLQVCNCSRLTKREVINITDNNLTQITIPRCNLNLKVYGSINAEQFWPNHGAFVKTLKLFYLQMQFSELLEIINHCPNLENLTLSYDLNLVGLLENQDHGQRETVSLKVDLTQGELQRLKTSGPKLKRFQLKNCNVIGGKRTVKQAIKLLIAIAPELDFSGCSFITQASLKSILNKIGHQLTGWHLSNCKGIIIDQSLSTIAKTLIKLENLKLDCLKTIDLLLDFLKPLRNLKFISLRETDLTNNVLLTIAGFEFLRGFDIGIKVCNVEGSILTSDGFVKAFGQRQHPNFIDIRLQNMDSVNNDVLAAILPQMLNLVCLDLSYCSDITEQGVSAIVTNCERLKYLSLQCCYKIETLMEPVSINNLKSLVYLNLFGCHRIPVMETVNELKLKLLRTIDLTCTTLLYENLKTLMVNCPSLQRVHLGEMDGLDLYEVQKFNEITEDCKFTRHITALRIVSIFDLSTR